MSPRSETTNFLATRTFAVSRNFVVSAMGRSSTPYEVSEAASSPRHGEGAGSFRTIGPGRGDGTPEAEGAAYFVEFRVAENGVYGHSYIAHGRLGRDGMPRTVQYADIHPIGGFASTVVGHFLPIRAVTEPEPQTLERRTASVYRRALTPSEYQRLTQAIAQARAAGRRWNVLIYNCNDFLADVARAIGLRTPRTLMRPYAFVPALRRMNEPQQSPTTEAIGPAGLPQPSINLIH